jgi:hypothetical protein
LERLAVVYVRQSTPKQVLENRESTARQYAFADQAAAWGWPRERIVTIDAALGKSGRTAEGRSGFQRLVTAVTLHYGVFYWLLRHDMRLPIRARTGAKKGQLDWRRPSIPTLAQMLRHPIYAGAYASGRRPTDPKRQFASNQGYRPWVPMEQWRVWIKDHQPASITWERYLKNRERIQQNQNRPDSPGVPRRGAALLPGVLVCGNCGRHMPASYHRESQPHDACGRYWVEGTEPRC